MRAWSYSIDEAFIRLTSKLPCSVSSMLDRVTRSFRPQAISPAERYDGRMLSSDEANALLQSRVSERGPFMASRFGAYELGACAHFWRRRTGFGRLIASPAWPDEISDPLFLNAGVFPKTTDVLDRFAQHHLEAASQMDAMACWHRPDEYVIKREYVPNALQIPLGSLTPYRRADPWTEALEGKRVLVIHPFETSIRSQYAKRELLFANPRVLPKFELIAIRAIQAVGGNAACEYDDWFSALEKMQSAIASCTFDVALIGAGAFGLPLAAFVKSQGRTAVHIGGALQLLFGIKGKRWDERGAEETLYNEHWVRPLPEETPNQAGDVEQACYW